MIPIYQSGLFWNVIRVLLPMLNCCMISAINISGISKITKFPKALKDWLKSPAIIHYSLTWATKNNRPNPFHWILCCKRKGSLIHGLWNNPHKTAQYFISYITLNNNQDPFFSWLTSSSRATASLARTSCPQSLAEQPILTVQDLRLTEGSVLLVFLHG